MEKLTIDYLRDNGLIAYEYIRGSHLHGLNTETSDIDLGGVFFAPIDNIIGINSEYIGYVSDEKNDKTYYEFGRWMELLLKSNPNALESLFVPEQFIIGKVHPLIQEVLDCREKFLSKESFESLTGYAKNQIYKARGLNKKIVNPIKERLCPLDFAYTFYKQGSTKIENWLSYRNLEQRYCGLVNIPNMTDTYGCYYDWGNFFKDKNITLEDCIKAYESKEDTPLFHMVQFIIQIEHIEDDLFDMLFPEWFNSLSPIGYRGIVGEDKLSNELRLSSIPKNEIPICNIFYNKNAYTSHCIKYKEYKDWEKHRNPIRYESNLNKNYDAKNMCECMRLIHMGIELAENATLNVYRTWDREYLLNIKAHKFEYDEIIDALNKDLETMNQAIAKTVLPDKVDDKFARDLLVSIRKKLYLCNKF